MSEQTASDQKLAHPPVAAKHPITRSFHGRDFVDDYEWLRDKESAETRAYLDAENAWTAQSTSHLKPLEDSIFAESPVFVVADGISGSNHGDLASAMVTDAFARLVGRTELAPEVVAETLQGAHRTVVEAQRRDGHDSASTACGAGPG